MPPRLGLVCLTEGERIRYRTITKTRLESLEPQAAADALRAIYVHNACVLDDALTFCSEHGIALFRLVSGMFPFADAPIGARMLRRFGSALRRIGSRAARLGIRLVSHPTSTSCSARSRNGSSPTARSRSKARPASSTRSGCRAVPGAR